MTYWPYIILCLSMAASVCELVPKMNVMFKNDDIGKAICVAFIILL
jgi:hypothetical protein